MNNRNVRRGLASALLAFFIFGGSPATIAPDRDASAPDTLRHAEHHEYSRIG